MEEMAQMSSNLYEPFIDIHEESLEDLDFSVIYSGLHQPYQKLGCNNFPHQNFLSGSSSNPLDLLQGTTWEITTTYVEKKTGFFSKTSQRIALQSVRDISLQAGCMGTQIDLYCAGTHLFILANLI